MSALVPGSGRDLIEVHGIRARGHHGVLESERATGQPFIADVILAVDTREAADSDDLADTVDYSQVAQAVYAELAGDPVDLIETLAERIAIIRAVGLGVAAFLMLLVSFAASRASRGVLAARAAAGGGAVCGAAVCWATAGTETSERSAAAP